MMSRSGYIWGGFADPVHDYEESITKGIAPTQTTICKNQKPQTKYFSFMGTRQSVTIEVLSRRGQGGFYGVWKMMTQ
jgi:hypothetical protein